ncbi:MAG TPA: nuclear transport factor 2 family protein [Candidatus Dormibacteraeota bacterium]|nr:nuclear transport factor 2 family protein [Candidatus Dormibacteraeota bacterium]
MNALPDAVAESNATAPAGGQRYEVQLRATVRVVIGCCAGESAQVVKNRERRMRLRPSCLRTSNRWGAELWHASVALNVRGCGIARSVGASIVARVLSPATVGSRRGATLKRIAMMLLVTTISAAGIPPFARAACAQVTDHSAKMDDPAEQEIRKLNAQEVAAFLQNDPKSMARLWSDDFVVTNPLNKFVTKQQVLGMVESGFLVITSYDRQIEYVRFYGDTAIVAGNETVKWGGRMPNAGKTEHLRFTAVWMKQAGRWQEVARHANIVPEQ